MVKAKYHLAYPLSQIEETEARIVQAPAPHCKLRLLRKAEDLKLLSEKVIPGSGAWPSHSRARQPS